MMIMQSIIFLYLFLSAICIHSMEDPVYKGMPYVASSTSANQTESAAEKNARLAKKRFGKQREDSDGDKKASKKDSAEIETALSMGLFSQEVIENSVILQQQKDPYLSGEDTFDFSRCPVELEKVKELLPFFNQFYALKAQEDRRPLRNYNQAQYPEFTPEMSALFQRHRNDFFSILKLADYMGFKHVTDKIVKYVVLSDVCIHDPFFWKKLNIQELPPTIKEKFANTMQIEQEMESCEKAQTLILRGLGKLSDLSNNRDFRLRHVQVFRRRNRRDAGVHNGSHVELELFWRGKSDYQGQKSVRLAKLPFATKIQAGAINNKGSVVVFAHQNLVHVVTAANDGFKFRNVLVPLARLNKTVQDITFLGNTDTCILLLKDELQANPCELIVFDPHTVAEPSTAPTTFSLGAVTSGTAKDSFLVSLDDKKFGVIGSNAQSLLFFEHNKNRLKLKASRSLEKPCKYARVIKSNATSRLGIICEPEKSSNRSYFDVQGVFVRKNEILSEESETLVAKFIKEFGKQEWSHAAYLH